MISGNQFRDAILAASSSLNAHRQEVDELNVFPVPDGDTGTNMSMTIGNAARRLPMLNDLPVGTVAEETASCLLKGARGNSGVILSLLFRGISKGLKGLETADSAAVAAALTMGVESAYKAVMKPTEGTILTVARVAAERARKAAEEGHEPVAVFERACEGARQALATTPELLPVLKKAGVVDSGGRGLCIIYDAMLSSMKGEFILEKQADEAGELLSKTVPVTDYHAEITFTYCTEIIIKKKEKPAKEPITFRAFIESIGDSAVFVDDDEIIKIHVHTDNPGKVLQEGLSHGELITIKIENMREQNRKIIENQAEAAGSPQGEDAPKAPDHKYGFVAIAAGEGLVTLFKDLGAEKVVEGGQTMNPSTDEILRAIESTPAEVVFVLPNNKNIIMAAEQAIPLASRKVFVLPTFSVPMGIAAMLAFDEEQDENANVTAMRLAADSVGTGLITYAVRDSNYEEHFIKAGELMAMKNGKLAFVEQDLTKAVYKLVKSLVNKDSFSVTLIYGSDVQEKQAQKILKQIEPKFKDVEITLVSGGQPVYYFIISVE